MSNAFDHETTPFAAYGEFDGYDQTADWTDEDWAEYDRQVGQDIADWEAQTEPFDDFLPSPEDFHSPF